MNTETTPKPATSYLGQRPWLFVVAAFVLLFSAWTTLLIVATANPVKRVPLAGEAAK